MQNKIKFNLMKVLAAFIFIFGLLTIFSGGSVLVDESARKAAGAFIPFIVRFNVLAGVLSLLAGVAIWQERPFTQKLVTLLFVAYLAADAYLLYHVQSGEAFEMRTVYAMLFRTIVWGGTSLVFFRASISAKKAV